MTTYKPPSPPFIPARFHGGRQTPRALVLHGTVSSDNPGTARNIAAWWHGPTSPETSAHYLIDPRTVIQCVGDHTVAYHCGYNTGSIALEFCDEQTGPPNRWADRDSLAILKRGARLAAELCLAYDIRPFRPTVAQLKAKGPHGIYGHNDSRLAFGNTTHSDPRDFPWEKFMRMVRHEIDVIKGEAKPKPKPKPKPEPKPKPKTRFKVLHAPLHGVSATRKELGVALRRPCVSYVNFTEGSRRSTWLKTRLRWRAVTGGTKKDARGRMVARDIVLMVRKKGRKHLEHDTVLASHAVPASLKVAPERHLSYTVDEVDGKPLAVIGFHPNAAVKDSWGSERAAEYRHSMRKLVEVVLMLREKYGADLDFVIVGDLNHPDDHPEREWAPLWVAQKLGDLSYVNRGVDWILWSKGLRKISSEVIGEDENGQDHPWIEVELARR